MTQTAFDKLLAELDPIPERAGEKYEQIRQKLMKFFKWRGCGEPEEYTDSTIDRVARKIDEGAELRTRDPYLYFHGVALNVLREYWKGAGREMDPLDGLPHSQYPSIDPDEVREQEMKKAETEQRLACLDNCIRTLPTQNLEIIKHYHQGEGGAKIKRRKELAAALDIPINALRIRAHRIRRELEDCVNNCVKNAQMA